MKPLTPEEAATQEHLRTEEARSKSIEQLIKRINDNLETSRPVFITGNTLLFCNLRFMPEVMEMYREAGWNVEPAWKEVGFWKWKRAVEIPCQWWFWRPGV